MPKHNGLVDYQQLSQQLEHVMAQLQDPSVDIDAAVRLFEQALKLTQELEDYLKKTENHISELKVKFYRET